MDDITRTPISRRTLLGGLVLGSAALGLEALDPLAADAASQISTIKIPKLGLVKPVFSDTRKATLNRGIGHWSGTVQPGQNGNCVLFGHRTSAGGPLRYLHLLNPGDKLRLAGKVYTITKKEIIRGGDTPKMLNFGESSRPYLSLASCSRANGLPTSLTYRLVIRARN